MNEIRQGPYTATRLGEGFWAIDQVFVRSFLIEGKDRAMLVDSCDADDDLPGLVARLTDKPVVLVQTHSDSDHIGASLRFEDVRMHPSEFARLRQTSALPLAPRALREGEVVDLGGRAFEVLLVPGHTPGSIVLLDRAARLLLSGDSVAGSAIYLFGPGRDVDAYIDSLTRLQAMEEAFDTVWPCHGPMPVEPQVLPDLIEGAARLRRGELEGVDDGSGVPALLYTHKTAKFYF